MIDLLSSLLDEPGRSAVSAGSLWLAGNVPPASVLTAALACLLAAVAGLVELIWRTWLADA